MKTKTINFSNNEILNALTTIAKIKFGYSENGKYHRAATNNPLANRALMFLSGTPAGPYRYLRCMNKINLANVTYSYIIGSISKESFKEFLDEYDRKDKWFWEKNDSFNTHETKLLSM